MGYTGKDLQDYFREECREERDRLEREAERLERMHEKEAYRIALARKDEAEHLARKEDAERLEREADRMFQLEQLKIQSATPANTNNSSSFEIRQQFDDFKPNISFLDDKDNILRVGSINTSITLGIAIFMKNRKRLAWSTS